jgi:ABC-2 type transport system ATP-binding protein
MGRTNHNVSESIIEIEAVSRRFGSTVALDRVSLSVPGGCVYGLVGVNGAGKTTLIKHILGLLKAKTGSVRVFGKDPVKDPVGVLGRIGYLSEERDLPEWMRLDELMRYTQAYYPRWDQDYADELRRTFGLDPTLKVKNLSKGMRAQVGLIAAVAHRPELLVLDDPSTGLDAVVRRDILTEIIRTVADEGRTVLFSSHLLDEVELMSDYVAMIHEGNIVLRGELGKIKEQYHHVGIRFDEEQTGTLSLAGALAVQGQGRTWTAVCNCALEKVRNALSRMGGKIVRKRHASLEEIFVARVGKRYVDTEGG